MRKRPWAAWLALTAVLALAGCGVTPTSAHTATSRSVEITFYGWPDNSPPGAGISYDDSPAGGAGSYADPITLASDPRELPVGTRVYVPCLHKYFIMEDDCAECITAWTKHRSFFDLWIGGQGVKASTVLAKENKLTPARPVSVIVTPPANEPVDTKALLQY